MSRGPISNMRPPNAHSLLAALRLVPVLAAFMLPVSGAAPAGANEPPGSEGRTDLSAADGARVTAVTKPAADFSKAEKYEAMAGGAAT